MTRLSLQNISKTLDRIPVLKEISLDVKPGELMVIIGPSGCGKSTLLNVIAGLESNDSGHILFDGQPVEHLTPKARDVAMVFQNYALYPHKTVFGNLSFGLKMRGFGRKQIRERVEDVARQLEIHHLLKRKPGHLSGGECQRVAMGRALVRNPKIFLMDEPLSNLDALLRTQIRTEIKKLHARLNTTMVFVTHDQIEAMGLADRIAVMNQGRIIQVGTPDEIYQHPMTHFVATFMGNPAMNFLSAHQEGDNRFKIHGSPPPKPPDKTAETCFVGFRPEKVRPGVNSGLGFKGRVQILEPTGADIFAIIDCGGYEVRCRLSSEPLTLGQQVSLGVARQDLHVFNAQSGQRVEDVEIIVG
ncbi:ABC transporter ATP-binding protein [Desulfospira joergensenii]|uniref:ABC transporter ATP-binding protein n=1 Tax=Desulfospira joergensenii TaxID=53329 RepID=UPI0003B2F873|nr:ATP-binding cassette domain-containing protein [Desulfospira joergensenii]